MSELLADLMADLNPEELEPRLELQVFIDPMSAFTPDFTNNCCRDGGNCAFACDNNCRDAGNCNTPVESPAQFVPGRIK
jgi:hypothetical protein